MFDVSTDSAPPKPVEAKKPVVEFRAPMAMAPQYVIPTAPTPEVRPCPPGFTRNFQGLLVKIPGPTAAQTGGYPVVSKKNKFKKSKGSEGRVEREERALLALIAAKGGL